MKTRFYPLIPLACLVALFILYPIVKKDLRTQHETFMANRSDSLQAHLLQCVKVNGGDRGCDSCFFAVYGYYNPDTTQYSFGHYRKD